MACWLDRRRLDQRLRMVAAGRDGPLELDPPGDVVEIDDLACVLAVERVVNLVAWPERMVLGLEAVPIHDALLFDPHLPDELEAGKGVPLIDERARWAGPP